MKLKILESDKIIPVYIYLNYGVQWTELDVNVKNETQKTIVIESPIKFNYAQDGNGNNYQVIDIRAITNTKFSITLIRVNATDIFGVECTNLVSDLAIPSTNDELWGVQRGFADNISRLKSTITILPERTTQTLFVQTTQDIIEIVESLRTDYTVTGDSELTTIRSPNGKLGCLGVYTYYYDFESGDSDRDKVALAFTQLLALLGNGLLVNAWVCDGKRTPSTKTVTITDVASDISIQFNNVNVVYPIAEVDKTWGNFWGDDNRLYLGNKMWCIGNEVIMPLYSYIDGVPTKQATLKSFDILGVGTMYRVFYSGNYNELAIYKNFKIIDLGFNSAIPLKTPSLYYQNKGYQVIADIMPALTYTQGLTSAIGGLQLFGKQGALLSAGRVVSGIKNGLNVDLQNAQEKLSFSNISKTGDVMNMLPIVCGDKTVYKIEFSDDVYEISQILNSYSSSSLSRVTTASDDTDVKYIKGNPMGITLCPEILQAGVYVCHTEEDLNSTLSHCCG